MSEFDRRIDRSGTDSAKWDKYQGQDVLPFWVADMDFEAPGFLLDALRARLEHRIFGYTRVPDGLVAAFQGWLERNYQWQVPEEWLVWIPGVVTGLNLAAMATAQPGGGVLIPTPVYYPFRAVPAHAGQRAIEVPLARDGRRWVMDIDALEAATDADTRILMIANPQNPTGRVYDETELQELAAFALRHDLVICSDEIHCPILLDQQAIHRPIASFGAETAARSISLYAATKAYNVPGLSCAVAVIPDADLRRRFNKARNGLTPLIGPLAYTASEAVFNDQSGWLDRLLAYLRGNHERVLAVAGQRMTPVEGTYLAWVDVRDFGLAEPDAHFERFGIGLSDGDAFGGPGFVRFNFGCPRSLLEAGLARFSAAIDAAGSG